METYTKEEWNIIRELQQKRDNDNAQYRLNKRYSYGIDMYERAKQQQWINSHQAEYMESLRKKRVNQIIKLTIVSMIVFFFVVVLPYAYPMGR